MKVEVRAAVRDDAERIADVNVAAWRAGYSHLLPDDLLYADEFDDIRRTNWTRWRFAPGQRVAVAVRGPDERVVGFGTYGPERQRAHSPGGRGELWAFYFHPLTWGSGAADALFEHVELRLHTEGFESAVLWVLRDNPRARAFYERHGWKPTGEETDVTIRDITLPEVEYRKDFA